VDRAFDGEEGHYLGESEPYDAVILDIGLHQRAHSAGARRLDDDPQADAALLQDLFEALARLVLGRQRNEGPVGDVLGSNEILEDQRITRRQSADAVAATEMLVVDPVQIDLVGGNAKIE